MPPTARMVAKRHKVRGYSWARMDEPELNVRIGGLYLGGLLKRWKGVLPMAVGSYNAGPGAMKRMQKSAQLAHGCVGRRDLDSADSRICSARPRFGLDLRTALS